MRCVHASILACGLTLLSLALQRDGETRLRAHLHATSEWQCSASREAAARACDARPECGALAAALRGSGTLRKIQLLQARSV